MYHAVTGSKIICESCVRMFWKTPVKVLHMENIIKNLFI